MALMSNRAERRAARRGGPKSNLHIKMPETLKAEPEAPKAAPQAPKAAPQALKAAEPQARSVGDTPKTLTRSPRLGRRGKLVLVGAGAAGVGGAAYGVHRYRQNRKAQVGKADLFPVDVQKALKPTTTPLRSKIKPANTGIAGRAKKPSNNTINSKIPAGAKQGARMPSATGRQGFNNAYLNHTGTWDPSKAHLSKSDIEFEGIHGPARY